MMNHYSSPHPNYAHQLFVTPSKHIYVLKDGRLKWQEKELTTTLREIEDTEREYIVYYIVADHTSSALYAEVHSSKRLPIISEFLRRAWQRKERHFFHGIPKVILTPKVLKIVDPALQSFIEELGVLQAEPSSGFQAGVHQIRNFEKVFASKLFNSPEQTINDVMEHSDWATHYINETVLPRVKRTRRDIWESGIAVPGVLVTI